MNMRSGSPLYLEMLFGIRGRYSFAVQGGSTICPIFRSASSISGGTCACAFGAIDEINTTAPSAQTRRLILLLVFIAPPVSRSYSTAGASAASYNRTEAPWYDFSGRRTPYERF